MIRLLEHKDESQLEALLRAVKPEWLAGLALRNGTVLGWGDPLRGAFVLIPGMAERSEVHVAVVPEARGREALRMARWAIAWCREAGLKLVGRTPLDRRDARWFALAAGMRKTGEINGNMESEG